MSKKKKLKKTLVEQILDKAKISYESIVFSTHQAGDVIQIDHQLEAETIYKTLALIGNVTGPVIGIVPVSAHLSYKKLAVISGNKKVGMIPLKDLEQTTGYIHGANNPVGIYQTKKFPIYIDQSAVSRGWLIVSAGELGRSIKINAQDLAKFVQAEFTDLIDN
ncbi:MULTISPECIES: aminoacyl-tRNA deacylase [unclassified Enterococcus]|uniref:aminoacyl-tRNA deacylase n=1 Tax=unclassified Enterococcus TaxID=2608891 RepID=UPI001553687B|nr:MULTISPECIES: aminoacyl-tRNA deacylase [unclassified Enterococcus]MBS7576919.1 aminoacyl-tRNA deacylase [Enterococcus sp. MMGLQ5-2]MBS7584326.1 aminoacyl-tRNA deacylase [Enterococcus sp. MMGLQ5-1]NPD12182.1 aminoacyl-tRNA deacylase [Enterococcus sp. MMGLQ5-1]NPD36754.1 aminoacyl-tRNA deacylase [Enterococcus sp. MMGLQ5-2]